MYVACPLVRVKTHAGFFNRSAERNGLGMWSVGLGFWFQQRTSRGPVESDIVSLLLGSYGVHVTKKGPMGSGWEVVAGVSSWFVSVE